VKALILGVNGFIGNSLVRAILERTDWRVVGMDLADDKLDHSLGHPRFNFVEGDISINREWIEYQINRCDVVLPLVAIATPIDYVRRPLRVFELTFEENLRIVRLCVRHDKRVIFPSTSEVYGMCGDAAFTEDESSLVMGPVRRQRWIYACSKQLLDRVIWAYGDAGELDFTLIRPFNWIGPRLDDPGAAKEGSSRVVTQFIADLLARQPIRLVDGGHQKRCFTHIDDGIECLLEIMRNEGGRCSGQIFNIGNPANECSMKQLAHRLKTLFRNHPDHCDDAEYSSIERVSSADYYGSGYQDMTARKPDVSKARDLLGWEPRIDLDEALSRTLYAYLLEQSAPPPAGVAAGRSDDVERRAEPEPEPVAPRIRSR
jgi:UDP-4-amino-4-deoxy-L-arabinose formyltransferase/UDP-glucuronic acid dehydrogenase (UDP-4-keto-hexauronic acid decarboxylating)